MAGVALGDLHEHTTGRRVVVMCVATGTEDNKLSVICRREVSGEVISVPYDKFVAEYKNLEG